VPSPFTPGLGLNQVLSKTLSPLRALALLFSAVILRMRGKIAAKSTGHGVGLEEEGLRGELQEDRGGVGVCYWLYNEMRK
jgi:hypothetical protein